MIVYLSRPYTCGDSNLRKEYDRSNAIPFQTIHLSIFLGQLQKLLAAEFSALSAPLNSTITDQQIRERPIQPAICAWFYKNEGGEMPRRNRGTQYPYCYPGDFRPQMAIV